MLISSGQVRSGHGYLTLRDTIVAAVDVFIITITVKSDTTNMQQDMD